MTALGVLGFDGRLVSRTIHPAGTWIDGWNLNPAHHCIRGVGDLDGNGQTEAVITSDWGIGILGHGDSAFRCPFGAPRDTLLGTWRYDATNRVGRDRIMAVDNFTGTARPELLVWSSLGMTTLGRTTSGLVSSRLHNNGTRLGGWVLSTVDNHYWGCGRFSNDGHKAMVLTSPWGLGLILLESGTSLFMVPTGSEIGDWRLDTNVDRVRLIADLDGDGQDELLVSGLRGIAVLKMIDRRLVSIATHSIGANLNGFVVERLSNYAIASNFKPGRTEEILASNQDGLYILTLNENRLERRAFVANGTRVDGWIVNTLVNSLLAIGDLTGNTAANFLIRSPWGIGIFSVGTDDRFVCHSLHAYGTSLGGWLLENSDIIAGSGSFTARNRHELLVVKPSVGSAPTPAFVSTEFVNWHRNVRKTVRTVRPKNLTELVSAVRVIQSRGDIAGIAGSGWSYTECVVGRRTQALIDTSALSATLNGLLPDIVDDRAKEPGSRLVHVEAGIKLFDLNCRLDVLGLALPTLGGSRGQSLAGAMSTGVHGGDVSLPPIVDAVRAIHLVGAGGQQWWIEPAAGALTTKDTLDQAKARGVLNPSIKNIYDDTSFNAVLVAMGCAGVIYSVVIECRPAFHLRSTTTNESWRQAQQRIRDLAFRDRRPRFLEINVNPTDQSCRVTIRNETLDAVRMPAAMESPSIGVIAAGLGLLGPGALGLFFGAIGDYIARTSAEIAALGFVPVVGPGLQVKKTEEALRPVQDAHRLLVELNLAAIDPHNPRRVADILPTAINLIWAIGAFIVSGRSLVDQLQGELTRQQRPEGTIIGSSFRVMTGQPSCAQDGSQVHDEIERLVESYEYSVPSSSAIAFIDRLIEVITEQRQNANAIVVNLNLRFTGRSRATLSMQKFPQTCHIEIYTFRGLRGNDAFRRRLREVVDEFQAIPHWGQFHDAHEALVFDRPAVHGVSELERWREVIWSLSDGSEMFWSDFVRSRRLLP